MKIVMICDARSIHYKRWIRDLQGKGHEVVVFSPWKDETTSERVELVATPHAPFPMVGWLKTLLKTMYRIKLALVMRKQINRLKPDIVHSHFLTDSGWIGAWTKFHPFVVTIHGSDLLIHPETSFINRLVVRFVLKKADKVVIVANHFRDALKKFGCDEQKIEFIPNYVDDAFFTTADEVHERFRRLTSNPKIISARKMESIYDVGTFVRSIPIVLATHPNASFSIIGDGSQMESLQSLCHDLGILSAVRFFGRVDHDDLILHFRKNHIYVSTSISDGLAVTTIEALANGLYPVTTDIPANRALIKNGSNGDLFPCSDEQSLAQKICNLISHADDIERVILQNLAWTNAELSSTIIIKKMECLYRSLLS